AEHNLCDRPRDAPVRTGMGVAAIAFYTVLFAAGGTDVIAVTLNVSENAIIFSTRVACLVAPVVCGYVAYRLCVELAAHPEAGRRRAPAIVVRNRSGGYEVVEPPEGSDRGRAPVAAGAPGAAGA